jgi:anti-sigma factor RsiW
MMNDPTHLDDSTLNDYLDGLLTPAAHHQVAQHLANCPACSAQVAEFRALFAALEDLPLLAPQHDLAPAVVAAITSAPIVSPAPRILRRVLGLQLALVALLLLVVGQSLSPTLTEMQLAATTWWATVDFTPLWVQSHAIGTTFSVWLETVRGVDMAAIVALPTLPWTTVAALFVAVAVLWLAGNRWLLTPLTRTPRSLHRNDPL